MATMKIVLFFLFPCLVARQSRADIAHRFVAGGFQGEQDLVLPADDTIHHRARRQVEESSAAEPTITNYHIISTVTARYVSTSVIATVENTASVSQEVQFGFRFNPDAFISGFVMIVDDVPYVAKVREKVAAQKAYNEARRRGQSAAQVRQKDKSSSRFSVDLNLEPRKTVIFNLTYQELLRRDKGEFRHAVNVEAGQVVEDLRVEVIIIEPQGISSVDASWNPPADPLSPLVSFIPTSTRATVLFTPSPSQQSAVSPAVGLIGAVHVTYDVEHDLSGGDIQIVNGYFVHYISPEGIPPAPKKVIFIIDVSGSMSGQKIVQTREVMVEILSQLREIDYFNVLAFSSGVNYWRQSVVQATPSNVESAQAYVRNLHAIGGTNIHGSLVAGARQLSETDDAFPAMFLLTDGRPTSGVTHTQDILDAVEHETDEKVALFCIGFGNDVDDVFMERLASENEGLYRKIYVDSDAPLQMRNFFHEFATPLLYNIAVQYEDEAVDTNTLIGGDFISYFDGKELVVAGKLSEDFTGSSLNAVVTAKGRDQDFALQVTQEIDEELDPNMVEDFSQRMWAFLTIKDLLAREKLASSPDEKAALKERALELSLRYSFVTPLTSLLIIKPPENVPTTPAPTTPPSTTDPPVGTVATLTRKPVSALRRLAAAPRSRVGGDPHFVIDVPHSNLTICFDVQLGNGTYIDLLSDPVLGIYVHAEIVERILDPLDPLRVLAHPAHPSYLGVIGVRVNNYKIIISDKQVVIDSEIEMEWGTRRAVVIEDLNVTVHDNRNMTIAIGGYIRMRISLVHNSKMNQSHLDFQVTTNDGFSRDVDGLIGQFQYKPILLKNPTDGISQNGHIRGVMDIDGRKEFVFRQQERVDRWYDCWWAKAESYIGTFEQYIVPGLFSHSDYSTMV